MQFWNNTVILLKTVLLLHSFASVCILFTNPYSSLLWHILHGLVILLQVIVTVKHSSSYFESLCSVEGLFLVQWPSDIGVVCC
jgi:hypothetical protein